MSNRDPARIFLTANEIHIPVGRPVRVELSSADVIHSFWVPNLMGKQDLIPGRNNQLTLTATQPGLYRAQCAQFCGLQHAHMALLVIAQDPAEFHAWRNAQVQQAASSDNPDAAKGRQFVTSHACAACHTVRGTSAAGTLGPDLTHVASRLTISRRVAADNTWLAGSLDRGPANDQTGEQHADGADERGRLDVGVRLSRDAEIARACQPASRHTRCCRISRRTRATPGWRMPSWSGNWSVSGARQRHCWAGLSTVDHKHIGRRYIATAFVFLALGGVLAMLIRLQLSRPEARIISPDRYNQIFTMHGANMMFLFAVPVMEAVAVYLVPLMVGTRNIAFPRLNAFSYWMYLAGGILLWTSFVLDMAPDVGWFAYVPLSGPQYGAGKRADIWAQMITFTEVSALAVAVEIVVTVFKQRAPGMSLDRIPLFVWSMLVTAFAIILAMPAIMVASTSLILDRLVGTHFFNPSEGGDVLLWQHLFWFFGHPEVYIIFLPAVGMVSTHPADLRAAPGVRLPAAGDVGDRHRRAGVRPVGAPHVHHRPAAPRRELLHRIQHGDRDPQRRADLLLAGDAGRWAGRYCARRCCSSWRSSSPSSSAA